VTQLRRQLGLSTCILLVIGNIIGVGIFTTPGEIARGLPSASWILLAWVIGGLMATAGALTYAELGAMYPKAGGNYVFLREAYGPLVAFLYGCAYCFVTSPGAIALLSIGFAEYSGFQTGTWASKVFAVIVVLWLTYVNHRGVRLGAGVMNGLTSAKIVAMLFFVSIGFAIGKGQAFYPVLFKAGEALSSLGLIASALVPMAFAYSGWNSTVLVAEEVEQPGRYIPLSLILGTLATTAIYVMMNAIYLYAVPLNELVGEVRIADLTATRLFSPWAQLVTKGIVALSVLGCLSASLLSNPRTAFAMGRDGLFFEFTATVHPKHGTPSGAILFQGVWACVLITWGSFGEILSLLSVPLVIIFSMTVISVFIFRIKQPHIRRPYRCWGYPAVPAIYVLVSCLMIYSKWVSSGIKGLYGIGVFILGIPIYYGWKHHQGRLAALRSYRLHGSQTRKRNGT